MHRHVTTHTWYIINDRTHHLLHTYIYENLFLYLPNTLMLNKDVTMQIINYKGLIETVRKI